LLEYIRSNILKLSLDAMATFVLSIAMTLATNSFANDSDQYGTPFTDVPDPRDVVMYQVNTRAFSPAGDFQGVIDRLDNIQALGINVIYLMPIYPVGQVNSINSPYSITDYKSVGTEFGTLNDLRALVDGAHARGMAVILDFIANHTAWDHPWVSYNDGWYDKDVDGYLVSPNNWVDVVQFDFSNQGVIDALIEAMRYWVFTANVDGFRFDYAEGPSDILWEQAIDSLRNINTHELILLAEEGDNDENYRLGFDYNFDFNFYKRLKEVFNGGSTGLIDYWHQQVYDSTSDEDSIVRFTTNHDVNSSDGTPESIFGGSSGSLAAFTLAAYMKSVPMIYGGQEVGLDYSIPFPFTKTPINWKHNPNKTAEYTKIIEVFNNSEAIRRGSFTRYSSKDVFAFSRVSGSERVFVMVNTKAEGLEFTLPATVANRTWTDLFTGGTIDLGNTLTIAGHKYRALSTTEFSSADDTQIDITFATTPYTIFFKKPANWGNDINIYYWDARPENVISAVDWPGVSMTDLGDDWFSYSFTNILSSNLIFNDGTLQTGNLFRGSESWYHDGKWFHTESEDFPTSLGTEAKDTGITTPDIAGSVTSETKSSGSGGVNLGILVVLFALFIHRCILRTIANGSNHFNGTSFKITSRIAIVNLAF